MLDIITNAVCFFLYLYLYFIFNGLRLAFQSFRTFVSTILPTFAALLYCCVLLINVDDDDIFILFHQIVVAKQKKTQTHDDEYCSFSVELKDREIKKECFCFFYVY